MCSLIKRSCNRGALLESVCVCASVRLHVRAWTAMPGLPAEGLVVGSAPGLRQKGAYLSNLFVQRCCTGLLACVCPVDLAALDCDLWDNWGFYQLFKAAESGSVRGQAQGPGSTGSSPGLLCSGM